MQIKPTRRRGRAGAEGGETSSKGDVCKVAGCWLHAAGWLAAVEVNYSPVILLIATICSLELLQIDDNVSGESKQMMSPTEKIVCWRNRWASCCICWNGLRIGKQYHIGSIERFTLLLVQSVKQSRTNLFGTCRKREKDKMVYQMFKVTVNYYKDIKDL